MIVNYGILLLALGQVLVWAGLFYVFPALLLRWESTLGWSKLELTAAITAALFVSAIASPLAGRLIDKGYGALMMVCCTVCGGSLLILLGFVESRWQFYLLWSLIGVTLAGCLYEPCFALITRAYGASAKKSIIAVTLIAGFAGSISFPGAHLLADLFGWQRTVQVFGLVVIFCAGPMLWFGADRVERDARRGMQNLSRPQISSLALLTPAFVCMAVAFALLAMVHGITLHHLLFILADRGLSRDLAVPVASLIGPMQVAGRVMMMVTEKSLGNHAIACATFLVLGLANIVLFATTVLPSTVFLFVLLFGGGYGIVSIIRPVIARDVLGGEQFGSKTGLLALFYLVGSASAPYFGSLAWAIGGYNLVLAVLMIFLFLGLVLYLQARRLAENTML